MMHKLLATALAWAMLCAPVYAEGVTPPPPAPLNEFLSTAQPSPAAATTSAQTMFGLGSTWVLPVKTSGRVQITVSGRYTNSTGGGTGVNGLNMNFGTGGAPANGAATTGTAIWLAAVPLDVSGASTSYPLSQTWEVTGLTPGTTYWFDLTGSATAGTFIVRPTQVIIREIPN